MADWINLHDVVENTEAAIKRRGVEVLDIARIWLKEGIGKCAEFGYTRCWGTSQGFYYSERIEPLGYTEEECKVAFIAALRELADAGFSVSTGENDLFGPLALIEWGEPNNPQDAKERAQCRGLYKPLTGTRV